jgi:hypothetical protein
MHVTYQYTSPQDLAICMLVFLTVRHLVTRRIGLNPFIHPILPIDLVKMINLVARATASSATKTLMLGQGQQPCRRTLLRAHPLGRQAVQRGHREALGTGTQPRAGLDLVDGGYHVRKVLFLRHLPSVGKEQPERRARGGGWMVARGGGQGGARVQ